MEGAAQPWLAFSNSSVTLAPSGGSAVAMRCNAGAVRVGVGGGGGENRAHPEGFHRHFGVERGRQAERELELRKSVTPWRVVHNKQPTAVKGRRTLPAAPSAGMPSTPVTTMVGRQVLRERLLTKRA
jgi:hypothetical protein